MKTVRESFSTMLASEKYLRLFRVGKIRHSQFYSTIFCKYFMQ